MPTLKSFSLTSFAASDVLFGANILATRGDLVGGGEYDSVLTELEVPHLRYPGGALTELYFDIANPDADIVYNRDTGEGRSFIPISDMIAYAGKNGISLSIVLPTRDMLSRSLDANGDRVPDIDEALVRGFVRDVVSGTYGHAEIAAFELGNEYWGSGRMSSTEYGRLASELSVIVNEELTALGSNAEIIVQSGTNFNFARLSEDFGEGTQVSDILAELNSHYGLSLDGSAVFGSGSIDWTRVSNEIILSHFDTDQEQDSVDAVSLHLYSKGQLNENQRSFLMQSVSETWGAAGTGIDISVTEWNTSGSSAGLERASDYGLKQSYEMLETVEAMMSFGVASAQVWPLIQNTANTLSIDGSRGDLTPAGEMFDWMRESIPGKVLIDLDLDSRAATELDFESFSVHGFYGAGELIFYIANTTQDDTSITFDFSGLVASVGEVDIQVLGVGEGQKPGSNRSDAEVRVLNPGSVLDGTELSIDLLGAEIAQFRMAGFTPSDAFHNEIGAGNTGAGVHLSASMDEGFAGLSSDTLDSFIELYIAYFNRAPDAGGLNFWSTMFANGTSFEEMATLFADQDETLAVYPAGTSNEAFAETVYSNVLGRTPDPAGFGFWVEQLETESVSRDHFILEVLRGVQPGSRDRAYLDDKVDIGAYFAVDKGMSDAENAAAVMALFDGSEASMDRALSAIDGYYGDLSDPTGGESVVPVIGVLNDPFA